MKKESIDVNDCKSFEATLKTTGSVKNRMLRIDLAQVKEKMYKGVIKVVQCIDSKEQLTDSLTKQNASK